MKPMKLFNSEQEYFFKKVYREFNFSRLIGFFDIDFN